MTTMESLKDLKHRKNNTWKYLNYTGSLYNLKSRLFETKKQFRERIKSVIYRGSDK